MTKRRNSIGLCVAVLIVATCAIGRAADLRETPTVLAVKRAKSSVVNIRSEKTSFAGDPVISSRNGRKVNGMGTGIVIDERGYIVTNQHVVNGVDSLRVTLEDGSTYNADVIEEDPDRDLAIIKIKPSKKLSVMPLGTSSDLMLGETVIAVGNAFGYEHTVTKGIVSYLSRDVEVNEKQSYENLIQTDASINPGNSGGPLLNLKGEVVGINVAIRAGAQRIGFAIPIDDAREIIAELLKNDREKFDGTRHGLVTQDVKSGVTRKLVVESAEPKSPAEKAGFQSGDEIVKIDSTDVVDGVDLERALLGRAVGEAFEVVVRRNDETESLELVLEPAAEPIVSTRRPDKNVVVRANNDSLAERIWRVLGLRLVVVPPNHIKLVGSDYDGGMQIVAVRSNSPAAASGMRQSDILVGLDRWVTISSTNISWVLDHHRKMSSVDPLKFHIVREEETLSGRELVTRFGFLRVADRD